MFPITVNGNTCFPLPRSNNIGHSLSPSLSHIFHIQPGIKYKQLSYTIFTESGHFSPPLLIQPTIISCLDYTKPHSWVPVSLGLPQLRSKEINKEMLTRKRSLYFLYIPYHCQYIELKLVEIHRNGIKKDVMTFKIFR